MNGVESTVSRGFMAAVISELTNDYPDSSIIGYKALGTNIIVLNTVDAANELLDRRSAIYSDRYVAC